MTDTGTGLLAVAAPFLVFLGAVVIGLLLLIMWPERQRHWKPREQERDAEAEVWRLPKLYNELPELGLRHLQNTLRECQEKHRRASSSMESQ